MKNFKKSGLCPLLINAAIVGTFIFVGVANAGTFDNGYTNNIQSQNDARMGGNGKGVATGEADFTLGMTFKGDGSADLDSASDNGWTGYGNGTDNMNINYVTDTSTDAKSSANGMGNGTGRSTTNGSGAAEGSGEFAFNVSFKARGTSDMSTMADATNAFNGAGVGQNVMNSK